jgi:hypothetical protein
MPPLKAAIGTFRPSGSTSIRRPRGGRPLVSAKSTPRSCSRRTASIARGVRTLAFVTSVPSTSASTAAIGRAVRPFPSDTGPSPRPSAARRQSVQTQSRISGWSSKCSWA